jgi:hypothetical protein
MGISGTGPAAGSEDDMKIKSNISGRRLLITALIVAVAMAVAGCGTKQVTVTGANGATSTTTVKNIHFANTKFVLHAGLAFGAFHRYIYKPLRAGALRSGTPGRLRTLAKGAVAAAFIVHELRIARDDAMASNQLRPLVNKLDNLGARLRALIPGLKNGAATSSAIQGVQGATSALGSQSDKLGFHIKDIAHAV